MTTLSDRLDRLAASHTPEVIDEATDTYYPQHQRAERVRAVIRELLGLAVEAAAEVCAARAVDLAQLAEGPATGRAWQRAEGEIEVCRWLEDEMRAAVESAPPAPDPRLGTPHNPACSDADPCLDCQWYDLATEDSPAPGEIGLDAHRELLEQLRDDREGRR